MMKILFLSILFEIIYSQGIISSNFPTYYSKLETPKDSVKKIGIALRGFSDATSDIFLYPDLEGCPKNSTVDDYCGYVLAKRHPYVPIKFQLLSEISDPTTTPNINQYKRYCIRTIENPHVFLSFDSLPDKKCGNVDNEICLTARLYYKQNMQCKEEYNFDVRLIFRQVVFDTYFIMTSDLTGYLEISKLPEYPVTAENSLVARTHLTQPSMLDSNKLTHFQIKNCNYLVGDRCYIHIDLMPTFTQNNFYQCYFMILQAEYYYDPVTTSAVRFVSPIEQGNRLGSLGLFVKHSSKMNEDSLMKPLKPNTKNILRGILMDLNPGENGSDPEYTFLITWDSSTPAIMDSESSLFFVDCNENVNRIKLVRCQNPNNRDLYKIITTCKGKERILMFKKGWPYLVSNNISVDDGQEYICFNLFLSKL